MSYDKVYRLFAVLTSFRVEQRANQKPLNFHLHFPKGFEIFQRHFLLDPQKVVPMSRIFSKIYNFEYLGCYHYMNH